MFRPLLLLASSLALALSRPTTVHAQEYNPPRLDRFGDPMPVEALARLGTVRFHHCECAAYSPDGKIIVTGDDQGTHVWEAATGKKVRLLPFEKGDRPAGAIFSHDGKKLAVINPGGLIIQIWDVATFNKILGVEVKGGGYGGNWDNAAAFSSDDKTLVSATPTTIFVWETATGKKLNEMPYNVGRTTIHVRLAVFSQDGKLAATRDDDKVQLWNAQTGKLLHELTTVHYGDTMKFSPDGKLLIVPGVRHWMNVFSVETGKKLPSIQVSEGVVSLAFSPDGKTLAAASNENRGSTSTDGDEVIQLWNMTNLEAPPVRHKAPGIHSVMFSPDGKTLAWGSYRQTLCFMDRLTGKDLRPTASHRGAIKALVYLPDGKRIVSASEDSDIRVWDATTGESLNVLSGHAGEISGLALYPNGKLLASCGRDRTFRLWDLEHGKSLAVLKDEGNHVNAAAFSGDGKLLASGGYRGQIYLRDSATGKSLEEFRVEAIVGLSFSPDGKTLAAVGTRGDAHLLNLATKQLKEIKFPRGVSAIAYSPDGKILAIAGDETMLIVDATTHRELKSLPGHWNRRGGVAFSPDGRYLASVSDGWSLKADRSIRVFEIATGTEIYSFKKELPIFAAAFSPDGSKLVVGGADATALVLDLKNLTGKKRREQLSDKELAAHWAALSAEDAAMAYEARADLLHAPNSAILFLAKHLQPAPAINVKQVEDWIKDLDNNDFKVRDKANKELGDLGELVRSPMQKALTANPPLETRQRLKTLLDKLEQITPSQLRYLRAIEILEGIGTPAALEIIGKLSKGNADGLTTVESKAVFARLDKQKAPLPPNPVAPAIVVAKVEPPPPPGPVLPDLDGDPMPAGAIARLGTARWRSNNDPRRIIVSPDGKSLAVVNSYAGLDFFDAQTGRKTQPAKAGIFTWGMDLRNSIALSANWQKIALGEPGEIVITDRDKAEKKVIDYRRKKEAMPMIPEEIEEAGSFSSMTMEFLKAVEFAPDGKTLVGAIYFHFECSGGKFSRVIKQSNLTAWNATTGKELWKSPAPGQVNMLMFSPDGKTITVVDETDISFWEAATGRQLRRWQSKEPLFSACYSPDRKWLATGSLEEVILWDTATGKVAQRLKVPGKQIKAVAFSPDGKLLVGGGDKTLRFWDPLTDKVLGDISAYPNAIEAVAFSSDGKTVFSGHEKENVLRRWDVASRKPAAEITGPVEPLRMLSFSSHSRTILGSAAGEEFHLWEAESGKPRPLPNKKDERLFIDWFASSGQAALLRCEDRFSAQLAAMLLGRVDRFDQIPGFLGSSVDGQRILIETEKNKLPCFAVVKLTKETAKKMDKLKDNVEREFIWNLGDEVHAALSPDGKTVVAAGNNVVCFYDVLTGKERRYEHPTNIGLELVFRMQSVKFSLDGSRIALVGSGGKIRILSVQDGRRIAEFAVKSHNVTGLAFSPDGQTLLTTSTGEPTYVWEIATGQKVRKLDAASYQFSPDNRLLAGAGETMTIFDLYSGRTIRECKSEGVGFGNVAFSPNSKLFAAVCSDTTILVWPTANANAPVAKPLDEKKWAAVLEKGNAAEAYEVIGQLIANPALALKLLEGKLHPVPKLDAKQLQQLIADLDIEQAKRRDAALKELGELGILVEPALQAALASGKVSPKSKAPIEKLLQNLAEKQPTLSAADIFHVRVIQALERTGTKQARQLLENLAQGAEMSPRTRAAIEALGRMKAGR
ncbi:MAG TPA: WD40 repeat domain-containing protein [Gemmataceae bacterium]|nr:WD40 repeat domain-containing protein [Gemmataceae bacterium]